MIVLLRHVLGWLAHRVFWVVLVGVLLVSCLESDSPYRDASQIRFLADLMVA